MKKIVFIALTAVMVCGVIAYATQDSTLSQRQVRDPRQLETILEANATDAESRIASLEGGSTVGDVLPGYIIVGNASTVGVDVAVSGDITMATNGAVALAADSVAAAEMADADHGDVAWLSGVATIDAGVVTAAKLATAVQDQIAYITVVGADLASAGTGTITIQLKDAAANNLAALALVRTWIGTADDLGVDALTDYSVTTGTQKEQVTDNGEYLAITDATGLIVMAVDAGGADSVWAWAEVGGRIVASGEVVLTAP